MMIPIKYNVRNLIVRRTTTLATGLGIALVVFVLAATLMLTEGLQRTMTTSGTDDTAIVIRKGADSELSSGIGDDAVRLIKAMPGVKVAADGQPLAIGEVVTVLYQTLTNGKGKSNLLLRGVPANVRDFRPEVEIVDGRWPKPNTNEAMIGVRVRGRFENTDLGGQPTLRKGRNVEIVGVFSSGGSSYESELWADLESVRTALGRENNVSSVRVRLESPAVFEGFSAAVEQDKRLGLNATREPDFYEAQSENTSMFITTMGTLIAFFFAVGAMIGAMITMYGAVAQRSREIGVLRALGFSRRAILFSFLLESVTLALIGGAIGAATATALGFVEFSMMNFQSFSEIIFKFDPTPEILTTSLIFGAAMGVVGGFLPAIRAARTKAVSAMRG